jgi:hypothetical protein
MDSTFKIHRRADHRSTNAIVFHVVPYVLVRIEFWRIRREKKELQLSIERLDEQSDTFRSMSRMSVQDEKNRLFCAKHESFQKLNKNLRSDTLLGGHKTKFASGTDGRDHIEMKPLTGRRNDRCLSTLSPGCPPTIPAWGRVPAYATTLDAAQGEGSLQRMADASAPLMGGFGRDAHRLYTNFMKSLVLA